MIYGGIFHGNVRLGSVRAMELALDRQYTMYKLQARYLNFMRLLPPELKDTLRVIRRVVLELPGPSVKIFEKCISLNKIGHEAYFKRRRKIQQRAVLRAISGGA